MGPDLLFAIAMIALMLGLIVAALRAQRGERRRIDVESLRLTRRDLEAFARALRDEVVGADDFLARARSPLPGGRGRA
jgi:hypothetical protein